MEPEQYTSSEMEDEIRAMVAGEAFRGEQKEFSSITGAFAARTRKTEGDAWSMVTGKIVKLLPDTITNGIVHHSLDAIGEQEMCKQAIREGKKELVVRQGEVIPTITFATFYPYLEYFLRAGPVDIMRLKARFKVEGKVGLKDTLIQFSGEKVQKLSGVLVVSAKISFCTDPIDVQLHQFDRPIRIG